MVNGGLGEGWVCCTHRSGGFGWVLRMRLGQGLARQVCTPAVFHISIRIPLILNFLVDKKKSWDPLHRNLVHCGEQPP